MQPLFETIVKHVKDPEGDPTAPVQMLVTNIAPDNYLGKLATGRIHNGVLNKNQEVTLIKRDGEMVNFKITRIFGAEGMNRIELDTAVCGDIVTVAGTEKFDIGETIADRTNPIALPLIDIDEPTLAMTFMVSTSPFVGREGKFVTSRNIWDRLSKEVEHNVSMKIERTESADAFIVKGRGELQLSILIENMRREGFELQVAKPQVIMRDIDGVKCEPIELAIIDVADEFTGVVIEKLGIRKGEMINMVQGTDGYTRLEFKVPARGLIGFRNEFMTETRGTGILNHSFFDYEPYKGEVPTRQRGVLISIEKGSTTAYSLGNVQSRGTLFANPGLEVYEGMIIGEHSRENDLTVNVTRGKQLTNMRASGTDAVTKLAPGREFTLEQALEYIADDELVEITPESIRMRKKFLTEGDRKRASRGTVR